MSDQLRGGLQYSSDVKKTTSFLPISNHENIFKACAPSSGLMEDPQDEGNEHF